MSVPVIFLRRNTNRHVLRELSLLAAAKRQLRHSSSYIAPEHIWQTGELKEGPSLHPLQFITPPEKTCDPLRILFFGTDEFSIASLQALHKHRADLDVKSIDVICRAPQRVGRGLKTLSKAAPIRQAAEELSLPLHEIDGFTPDWHPPQPDNEPINLLIAVSFGLLIPGRLIKQTQYGGLNLHPSALPDLRGAAPLHHALLQKRNTTAVSLQTLHPTKFDHGIVLARSGSVSIPEDIRRSGQVSALRDFLAPIGADLLVRGIYQRLFVPPVHEASPSIPSLPLDPHGITSAPKITSADKRIDWSNCKRADILNRLRILGPLWSMLSYVEKVEGKPDVVKEKRVVIHNVGTRKLSNLYGVTLPKHSPGDVDVFRVQGRRCLVVGTSSRQLIEITDLTVEGDKNGRDPIEALELLRTGDCSLWRETMKFS